jgi:DNA recombination protein RmuC
MPADFLSEPRLLGLGVAAFVFFVGCLILWRRMSHWRERFSEGDLLAREELARLGERAARLERIEAEHAALAAERSELRAETARLSATLAERDNETRRLGEDLGAVRAELADFKGRHEEETAALRAAGAELREKLARAVAAGAARDEEAQKLSADLARLTLQRDEAARLVAKAGAELADIKGRSEAAAKADAEKLALILEAKTQLSDQFKSLASDILEEKSRKFTAENQTTIGALLDPLRTQLSDFKGKVEEVYVKEGQERSALGAQVRELMNLNQQLSRDAHNLTSALRGQAKAQGNWGELILERVLEAAGLTKGVHYVPQESHSLEGGGRLQPDVVINMPGERCMVVDSKVSLIAYEAFVAAEDEAVKTAALRRHLDSLRGHIKDLASKNYQTLHGLKSLDFVILFVPIEPAFLVAVDRDPELWHEAWTQNILLVSPSQLMFVVRTVAQLWQKEQQTRNAQEIARRGALLYDKLAGFVDDLMKVGRGLRTADDAYRDALGKFSEGNGNVIRQAEMLKKLGVKASKRIDPALSSASSDDDDDDTPALPEPGDRAS